MQPTAAPSPPRIAALDAARALAVGAMVVGHTLDALLALSVRGHPVVATYWKARGLTAPLFLATAGWAVTVAIRRSGASGWGVVRGRIPRAVLLLAVGYALSWPGWGIDRLGAGDPAVWAHLLAFGPLHTIALSILATAVVLGLRWTVREQALALAALAVLAVSLGMRAPAPFPTDAVLPRAPAAIALVQAVGGSSPFPLFPWSGYFLAGALLGLAAGGGRRVAVRTAAIGGALVLASCGMGVGTLPAGHPALFVFRTGVVLVLLAALSAVPAAAAARLAPLGRVSLSVYALHIPIVYGWSAHEGLVARIGPTLPPGRALAIAAVILAGAVAASFALRAALRPARVALVSAALGALGALGARGAVGAEHRAPAAGCGARVRGGARRGGPPRAAPPRSSARRPSSRARGAGARGR